MEITSPTDGDDFKSGETLEITVTATDANTDGFITSVEVFDNDVSLGFANPTGKANSYLLSYRTSAADLGDLNLQARATDNQGNIGFSDLVEINVVQGAVPEVIINKVNGTVLGVVSVDALIEGEQYEIVTPGTTDFTTLGAADSNVSSEQDGANGGSGIVILRYNVTNL